MRVEFRSGNRHVPHVLNARCARNLLHLPASGTNFVQFREIDVSQLSMPPDSLFAISLWKQVLLVDAGYHVFAALPAVVIIVRTRFDLENARISRHRFIRVPKRMHYCAGSPAAISPQNKCSLAWFLCGGKSADCRYLVHAPVARTRDRHSLRRRDVGELLRHWDRSLSQVRIELSNDVIQLSAHTFYSLTSQRRTLSDKTRALQTSILLSLLMQVNLCVLWSETKI